MNTVIIIMGVSGSGKTTVGKLLAAELKLPFYDADDFHPEQNIRKMQMGHPLVDSDRVPWLNILSEKIGIWSGSGGAVLACSALKESYRKLLEEGNHSIEWVILRGTYDLILSRILKRKDHFFSGELLQSQFDTVEWPEYGMHIQIDEEPATIVEKVILSIELQRSHRIGLVGLGVMGNHLSRNIIRNGFNLSVYNRDDGDEAGTVDSFLRNYALNDQLNGFTDYRSFVNSLEAPRIIILMVKAGEAVDLVIEGLMPYLASGDILIDAGNSFYKDTERRQHYLKEENIELVGMGVSGGASGALNGPSLMPGGDHISIARISPLLHRIAARDLSGKPCVSSVSPGGSGHFIKMVHNGIEYAEMQLIAEVYSYLRTSLDNRKIGKLFSDWSEGDTDSYLLNISAKIFSKRLSEYEDWIDKISDRAGSKGTGNWTLEAASELGFPATMIQSAVSFRMISNFAEMRSRFSKRKEGKSPSLETIDLLRLKTVYQTARILNHHQGFELLRMASEKFGWDLDLSEIARTWTNGCIIRSRLMESCSSVLKTSTLLDDPILFENVGNSESQFSEFIKSAADKWISIPCFSSAFNYWLAVTTDKLPTNLIQAQRDFFGGHGFNRNDDPMGQLIRLNWNE